MPFSRIRERRQALGLSQRDLAQKTGIEQQTLAKIEGEHGNPTAANLLKLAQALHCSIDWLLENDMTSTQPAETSRIEREALQILQTKSPERQLQLLEILRLAG